MIKLGYADWLQFGEVCKYAVFDYYVFTLTGGIIQSFLQAFQWILLIEFANSGRQTIRVIVKGYHHRFRCLLRKKVDASISKASKSSRASHKVEWLLWNSRVSARQNVSIESDIFSFLVLSLAVEQCHRIFKSDPQVHFTMNTVDKQWEGHSSNRNRTDGRGRRHYKSHMSVNNLLLSMIIFRDCAIPTLPPDKVRGAELGEKTGRGYYRRDRTKYCKETGHWAR